MLLLINSWPSALPTETLNTNTLVLGAMVSLDWIQVVQKSHFSRFSHLDAFKSRWAISNDYLIKWLHIWFDFSLKLPMKRAWGFLFSILCLNIFPPVSAACIISTFSSWGCFLSNLCYHLFYWIIDNQTMPVTPFGDVVQKHIVL